MTVANTATHITHVGTVAVPVADQDRALAFYTEVLGFEKRRDMPFGPGQRWIEVACPRAVTSIALVAGSPEQPVGGDTGIRLISEDVESDHAAFAARGVDVDQEVLRFGGGVPPMFLLRDPDGNSLVIVGSA
ncbi:MAG TPA: VOC family protein [Candidatus Solibacter sp.]|jgi:catechol 2,3-dioxygenase-like lactoylglutathione lyase family enzyme|nr:VOC family protein [Candidatus Solibacter sp.]